MPEFAVIADLERHRTAVPIDHPNLSVTRTKLEYPTVDVSFAYLAAINKVVYGNAIRGVNGPAVLTRDSFTDKSVIGLAQPNGTPLLIARYQNSDNSYYSYMDYSTSTKITLAKIVNQTASTLASGTIVPAVWGTHMAMSCGGSTLKARWSQLVPPMDPLSLPAATDSISATDTSFASGLYGFRFLTPLSPHGAVDSSSAYLRAPFTPISKSLAILEASVKGAGSPSDPFAPALKSEIVEVSEFPDKGVLPEALVVESKKYYILRSKGFTDDEIMLLLGYIPPHQVDLDSVTWGAFEFSEKSPTNIIVITGDNPYKPGAVQRQIDFAESRGLRVFTAPKTYGDAVALYNQLRRDFHHWLAGKDNFAYQVLGFEELEPLAVIDFYYGELIEHRTHYDQIKMVPDWELRNTLLMWSDRLEKAKPNLPPDEYQKHREKLDKVLRLGW